jgi:ribulose-5-phosphate 4-epimerase/fuculose-1-phosphate aldolase
MVDRPLPAARQGDVNGTPMDRIQARRTVVDYAQRMYAEHLCGATFGNVSTRVGGERDVIAVTPTARPYDALTPEDVCIVELDGAQLDGPWRPTTELPLHAAIYAERPEVGAIMHTHSPAATTMAVLGWRLPAILSGLVRAVGGDVQMAPYARPGTAQLAASVRGALRHRRACFLAHHGLLAVGADCGDAMLAASATEVAARAYLDARAVDVLVPELPEQEIRWLASAGPAELGSPQCELGDRAPVRPELSAIRLT